MYKFFRKEIISSVLIPLASGLIAGAIFLGFYSLAISKIPTNFYQARDDGVITMSHAKNLAKFGTISINSSGERVEGFSSPLEFWLYYIVYIIILFTAFDLLHTGIFPDGRGLF